jgi:hypothetical protein
LGSGDSFVAFVDAVGELDGTPCVLEWKTSSARYPEEPDSIAALDLQLVCYSRMTGINEVAQVVFVRKRMVEVQYLQATITDQQRQEFETLVEDTVRRIESGLFLPHSGIRFPQNLCTTPWLLARGAGKAKMGLAHRITAAKSKHDPSTPISPFL